MLNRYLVAVGVVAFLGGLALWLGLPGDRAMAKPDRVVDDLKTVALEVAKPVLLTEGVESRLSFGEEGRMVYRLRLYLDLESQDPHRLQVSLVSPTGTRVLIVDGASSPNLSEKGIEGWFGNDALQSAGSLAAFAGEQVSGEWSLRIDSSVPGQLKQWKLSIDTTTDSKMASMAASSVYGNNGSSCDCNISRRPGERAALPLLAFLALVILPLGFRRR